MSKNMYTPLEEYMNMSAPQWAGVESYINQYKWGERIITTPGLIMFPQTSLYITVVFLSRLALKIPKSFTTRVNGHGIQ